MPVVVHVRVVDDFFVQFIDCLDSPVLCSYVSIGSCAFLGYVRVAFGTLNVESQCSWAAVTVLDRVLTMSSWSLVEAKMYAKVSIGSCGILWEVSVTVGLRSRGVWRSLCCESVFLSC